MRQRIEVRLNPDNREEILIEQGSDTIIVPSACFARLIEGMRDAYHQAVVFVLTAPGDR